MQDSTKTCSKCGEAKPRSEFHRCSGANDGLKNRCKPCRSVINKAHRKIYHARPDIKARVSAYGRALRKRPEYVARMAAYSRDYNMRPDVAAKRHAWGAANKRTIGARNAVNYQIRSGQMTKGPCAELDSTCSGRIEGHHESYEPDHWLDVIWLCRSHHERLHHPR